VGRKRGRQGRCRTRKEASFIKEKRVWSQMHPTHIQNRPVAVSTSWGIQLVIILLTIRSAITLVVSGVTQFHVTRCTREVLGVPLSPEGVQHLGEDGFLASSTHPFCHGADAMYSLHVLLQGPQHVAEVVHG
jgi:hypothetical protein